MSASMTAADVSLVRDIVSEVAAATRTDRLLSCVTGGAARLCQTRLAAVTMLTKSRDYLQLMDVVGTGGVIVEQALPVAGSLNGMVLASGRSFHSADVWHDPRPIVRAICRRNGIRGVLIVPLVARDNLLGTLAVGRRESWHFSARDQTVLEDFAHLAGTAIGNAHLGARLRDINLATSEVRLGVHGISFMRGESAPGGRSAARHSDSSRLTPRERDIVALLMTDLTCAEVASALKLSRYTVRNYLERLKLRFGQTTLHGLVGRLASAPPSAHTL